MAVDDAGAKLAKQIKDLEEKLSAAEADRDKWKDLSRKHEKRSEDNATAAAELKQLKDSKQTDEEKLSTKLADLEKRANDADHRALRAEIAQAKGLTPAQAKRLQGASKEELESDADDLLESFPAAKEGNAGGSGSGSGDDKSRKPRERLTGGGDPTDNEPVETNPAKLAASVPRY
jgi:Spy/CpxP family protein refolding chaperone